jgi:cation diffusion facilitator family transporter
MHTKKLEKWQHSHEYNPKNDQGKQNLVYVVILTLSVMVIEIGAGIAFGSMALLADGWHMGTHAFALGITIFAIWYANKHKYNPRFSFGTGKVSALSGYTSAIVLALVAILMIAESLHRFISPIYIRFNEALSIAALGLIVNLICVYWLKGDHHGHDHDSKSHDHDHQDHNLKAAYLHVLADTLTSILAITALLAGKLLAWTWMDPFMGIIGAAVILRWSYGLLRDTSSILLDKSIRLEKQAQMRSAIEAVSDNRVTDFHIWPIAPNHFAAILSIATHYPKPPDYYKDILKGYKELDHITVEVINCLDEPCIIVD